MRNHAALAGSIDQSSPTASEPRVKSSSDPGSYTRHRVGVSFYNLSCHGFVKSERYQATVFSYLLAIPKFIVDLVRTRPAHKVKILQEFEGLIRPGEMLLVLGRPGSGCSTFLKTLSGETNGFEVASESDICYQGLEFEEFHRKFKDLRVYLAELDVHFPELTLGQTLSFAASTRQRDAVNKEAKLVAEQFQLSDAFDTKIGNDMIRGISGGEKRRTSIAEAFIGGAQLQFWDNSTRGLDSLTALNFTRLLRHSTNSRKSTVVMSLYQASEAIYNMFDKVTLLYEGRQIYFGSADSAVEYFTSLGFVMPKGATTADFLTSLTSPAERVVRPGCEYVAPRLPEEFAIRWKHSTQAQAIREEIEAERNSYEAGQRLTMSGRGSSVYAMPWPRQAIFCMQRAAQRIRNDAGPTIGAIVANIILGLVIGSAFYNLPETTDGVQQRAVVIFFSLIVNSFSPAYEITLMWISRPVVEKQHRYAFYRPCMEALASIMTEFPNKLASSFGLHLPIYFLANLKLEASAFFIHWFFMLANMLTMSMLFRLIGSLSRALEESIPPVSVLSLLCVIYNGFVVPPEYMRPWLGWFWRINPVAYTYEGLMINEFRDRQFRCTTTIPTGPAYSEVGSDEKICTVIGSTPGQQYVNGSKYLSLKYGYQTDHLWRNIGILFGMAIPLCLAYLLAVQFIPSRPSRGEILFFKRGQFKRNLSSPDQETGNIELLLHDTEDTPKSRTQETDNIIDTPPRRGAATFHWESLSYKINTQAGMKSILSDINGWVRPGTLTALMGVTGAGKTALLDTLAGRITAGAVTGSIYVNGTERDRSFRRRMGYVQQNDIHLHTTTVREALQFSALLRQPKSTSKAEKLAYVEEVLEIMDMTQYAEAIVGVPGEGLNIEQRKRLTIAVEMASKPELLLFLDEPTSGLDSQTAWSICTLLRKLADSEQTILCTIHQPSSQLFSMFDQLLLLDKGGTTLYFGNIGPDAASVIKYFERQDAPAYRAHENPAEWILQVTGNLPETTEVDNPPLVRQDWSQKWESSPEKAAVVEELENLRNLRFNTPMNLTEEYQDTYATTQFRQFAIVSRRIFNEQWRDPSYTLSKITLCISLSFINGFSFYKTSLDIQGLTSLIFSMFLITQLFSCINQLIIPRFVKGRQLFEARERHSNSYTWSVFIAANIFTELVWQTAISVAVFVCWYYPVGLYRQNNSPHPLHERGLLNFILIWLFNLWANTMSQVFGAGIEHGELVVQAATLCFWLSLVFCGILVPPDSLGSFWIWMYRLSPLTYLTEGLALSGLGNATVVCSDIELLNVSLPRNSSNGVTCAQYLEAHIKLVGGSVLNPEGTDQCQVCPIANADTILALFGMRSGVAWRNVGIMAAYVVFNMLATFGIYWLARVPRKLNKRTGKDQDC
ncbi:unnamed protein product [Clonostachys rosea]|uniref:ABC transporter domain-containing protein n=1 Tax=Bionectria ochroleuca TaxID=29856 RepID=A0ABY6U0A5_BIOOC|nr:unnamed protein product [Clonostachys rosea]